MSPRLDQPLATTRRGFRSTAAALSIGCSGMIRTSAAWAQTASGIRTFRYRAPQTALDDLRQRVERTRWPERETVTDWSYGVPLAKMHYLADYWRTSYNWRRCEAALSRISQFQTTLDVPSIHFIHVRSKHPTALPIVMTHGWPGSIIEFMEIVAPLTDPTAQVPASPWREVRSTWMWRRRCSRSHVDEVRKRGFVAEQTEI